LPLAARAQQSGESARRLSVLLGIAENDPETQSRLIAFRQGLRDLGWIEGRNIKIDYHFAAADPERIGTYAAEIVRLAPDAILANGTPVVAALRQATTTIPIVFAVVNDPVGQGFISSLAHPGGNITGFTFIEFTMVGKWLGMLKEAAPSVSRAALIFNPNLAPYYDVYLRSFEAMQRSVRVDLKAAPARAASDIEPIIAGLAREPSSGLIVPPEPFTVVNRSSIISACDRYGVPAVHCYRQFVTEGALMSYGPDTADIFRRSASYVDRVLKGENPADLPAQSPLKFELAINTKTAKALGLMIPATLLALADEVIE
jgi:putative ABC transport system substrate-binding protein